MATVLRGGVFCRFRSVGRRFQPGYAFRDGFEFEIKGAQDRGVAFQAHFERAGPLVKLGEESGFNALQLSVDPVFIFVGEAHDSQLSLDVSVPDEGHRRPRQVIRTCCSSIAS